MKARYTKAKEILEYAIRNNMSVKAVSEEFGFTGTYFKNSKRSILIDPDKYDLSGEEIKEFTKMIELYNDLKHTAGFGDGKDDTGRVKPTPVEQQEFEVENEAEELPSPGRGKKTRTKKVVSDQTVENAKDELSYSEVVRNPDGQIEAYDFCVYIRDEQALEGRLTRDEMDLIYRLYSNNDGANLTQKGVSRNFPQYTRNDMRRILRAFNITKDCVPIAPHILEERSVEDVSALVFKRKEENFLKYNEQNRHKHFEKAYQQLLAELQVMKKDRHWFENVVADYFQNNRDIEEMPKPKMTGWKVKGKQGKEPLVAVFGDPHFGKYYDSPMLGRGYNRHIAYERLQQIARVVVEAYQKNEVYGKVVLMLLGDIVESILEDGMHPNHSRKMDLHQEQQIFFAVDAIKDAVLYIKENIPAHVPVEFYVIGGNHDRAGKGRDDDKNRTAAKIIAHILKRELDDEQVTILIPETPYFKSVQGKMNFFCQHGDSHLAKQKPSEIINLWGEPGCYNILLKAHWHKQNYDEGNNYLTMIIPPVCSVDEYALGEIGMNSLPGFVLFTQPEEGAYGVDFQRKTLY